MIHMKFLTSGCEKKNVILNYKQKYSCLIVEITFTIL